MHYMVILSQNCPKDRLVCSVKLLFSDAWSSLAAVIETFAKNRSSLLMPIAVQKPDQAGIGYVSLAITVERKTS